MKTGLFRRIILFVFIMVLIPSSSKAQSEPVFDRLEVDIWLEYDRPEALVIYRGELDSGVSLPVDLTFRIPVSVGMPHAVAAGQTNESLFSIIPNRQVDGEWAYISFTTTMPIIRLEYYDPGLNRVDELRNFEYFWPGDHSVNNLAIQVQQPLDATDLVISPSLGSGVIGGDGLVYYNAEFGSLSAGQTFDVNVSYNKASDELSISGLAVEPSAPITSDTPGRITMVSVLPWLLGLLGAVLIVGGIIWYWRSGNQAASMNRPKKSRGVRSSGKPTDSARVAGDVYCHECGKRANPGDRYCRSCGTRLRIE